MRKNILLVMPNVPYALNDWNIPPIGILYISSSLKQAGFNVYTLNLMLSNQSTVEIIKNNIDLYNIDIIATGDLVVNYQAVQEIVDIAKMHKSQIVSIIGGGLVTHSPKEAMEIVSNADYGIIGEGEIAICKLLDAIENNLPIENINGIIYRKNSVLKVTTPQKEIANLDDLPWPDYDGFQYFEIARRFSESGSISAGLTTSRSCPFNCTFCSTSGGKKYRQRSVKEILSELEFLKNKYSVDEFFLNDELFAVDAKRVYEFCKMVKKFNVKWHVMLRVGKDIKKELLEEMSICGCIGICYGLESADNEILKSMGKNITIEEILRVLKITKKVGLKVRGGFIFGDVKESMFTAHNTLKWIDEHSQLLENVSISPLVLYPGSQLYKIAVNKGKIENTIDFIKQGCPLVNISENLSDEEYNKLIYDVIPNFSAKFRYKIAMEYQKNLNESIVFQKGNNQYVHKFICEKCQKENLRLLYPSMMFQSHFVCPYCKQKYDFFPSFLYFKTFETEITLKLKDKNTVIWGCGETLQNLYYCNYYLQEHNLIIVDSNLIKQKQGFHGKPVIDPVELTYLECENIICCVGNINFDNLKKDMQIKYKNIKQVTWIYDVLKKRG